MSEMAVALDIIRQLPDNVLQRYPTGRWGFAGRVRADLCYERKDGRPLTEADIDNGRSFGPRLAGLKRRTWPTREAAELARGGYEEVAP